jgi:hypothetical protein
MRRQKMKEPASILSKNTDQTRALSAQAHAALSAAIAGTLGDEEAQVTIDECNRQLLAAGMPVGAMIISPSEYRKAWGV